MHCVGKKIYRRSLRLSSGLVITKSEVWRMHWFWHHSSWWHYLTRLKRNTWESVAVCLVKIITHIEITWHRLQYVHSFLNSLLLRFFFFLFGRWKIKFPSTILPGLIGVIRMWKEVPMSYVEDRSRWIVSFRHWKTVWRVNCFNSPHFSDSSRDYILSHSLMC